MTKKVTFYVDDELYDKIKESDLPISIYIRKLIEDNIDFVNNNKMQIKELLNNKSSTVNTVLLERDKCITKIQEHIAGITAYNKQLNMLLLQLELNTITLKELFEDYKNSKGEYTTFLNHEHMSEISDCIRDIVIHSGFNVDTIRAGNYPCLQEMMQINPEFDLEKYVERLRWLCNPCHL